MPTFFEEGDMSNNAMRRLRRQSRYRHQWVRGGRWWLDPEKLTVRQKLQLTLMSTFLGRTLLKILGRG
jgi:hypothetical protein